MFAHVEVYARKRTASKRSVHEVLSEARRDPGACSHVDNPQPPLVIKGCGIHEVERIHDALASAGVEWTVKGVARRLRSDTPTLLAAVFSHPFPMEDIGRDPDTGLKVKEWVRDTIAWAKSDIEARGGQFLSAVFHADETYPHLHIYAVHAAGRVDALHPGRQAKRDAMQRALDAGATKQQANRNGNNSYRQTMRVWQDRYWKEVASKHALDRKGPQRRRLSRQEWAEARADATLLAERIREAEQLRLEAQKQLQILDDVAKSMGVDLRSRLKDAQEAR